jgi:ribosomal protein S21
MANTTRVRVELRESGRGRHDRERDFRQMLATFRRRVNEAGIIPLWKKKQFHESKGEKRRRKRKDRELEIQKEIQKEKLRDYFGN